jgi:hypothetical protein
LTHLRLTTSNKITRLNKYHLLEAIRESCPRLKTLVFQANEIIPPEVEPILNSDRFKFEFAALEALQLKYMYEFNDEEMAFLADHCPQIRQLRISNSNLSDECVKIAVEKLNNLKELSLVNVKEITNDSLQHIANHHSGMTVGFLDVLMLKKIVKNCIFHAGFDHR